MKTKNLLAAVLVSTLALVGCGKEDVLGKEIRYAVKIQTFIGGITDGRHAVQRT